MREGKSLAGNIILCGFMGSGKTSVGRRLAKLLDREFCDLDSCRLVFAESDFLPALIIDKFADVCVMQSLALGIDRWREVLLDAVMDITGCRGIYRRDDVPVRELEGLEQVTGFARGHFLTLVEMRENGVRFLVDVAHGQKTGFFLDQKENRASLAPIVRGREVLDCFTHTGSFALHAASYGASHVTGVDVSEEALALVRKNAAENGVQVTTTCANVFDLVKSYDEAGRRFGLVICDPPAFAKSRKALEAAYRGYKELNLRCLRLTEPGGFLVTCSCSQFMTPPLFEKMLTEAAGDVGRPIRLIETLIQSRDHPACLTAEHALYLKGLIVQVL